MHASNTLKVP